MVGVIPLTFHGGIRLTFIRKTVVHANQIHLTEAHMIGQLQANVGYRGPLPNPTAQVAAELWSSIGGIQETGMRIHRQPLARPPREKLWQVSAFKLLHALLHHQVVY